jgi:hypothetical protein
MTTINIYSPKGQNINTQRTIKYASKMSTFVRGNAGKYDYNNARGSFKYIPSGHLQKWTADIKSIEDAVLISQLLTDVRSVPRDTIRPHYVKTYDLINSAGIVTPSKLIYSLRKSLNKWIKPEKKGRSKNKKVKNPKTGRFILKRGRTYKKIFMNIKLLHVKYPELHNYKTIDYDISGYCVPSYLKHKLSKKEYNKISELLDENKTPTGKELTNMLNSIGYGLNAYVKDGECIQKQPEYKKKINVMIANKHLYILMTRGDKLLTVKTNVTEVSREEYDAIGSEYYTSSKKIYNGQTYVCKQTFCSIEKILNCKGEYSQSNVHFYMNCGIRAARYINKEKPNISGVDINQCYKKILENKNYEFAVQTGNEITTKYTKGDKIREYGFYYYTNSKAGENFDIVFGSSGWISGDIIKLLRLEKKLNITHKHVSYSMTNGDNLGEYSNIDVSLYTGYLAKYETSHETSIACRGKERKAFMAKYDDKNGLHKTSTGVTISEQMPMRTSGMYAYLSIILYSKYQLLLTIKEVQKIHKNANVHKLYTDSVMVNVELSSDDIKNINKKIRKHKFSVKGEHSIHSWEPTENTPVKPIAKRERNKKEHDDVKELLGSSASFCLNARAGYGKTYILNHEIKPTLDELNKKYVICSTTKSNAKSLNCEVINSVVMLKKHSMQYLKDNFKNIDYIIIDEASRIGMPIMNRLEIIKRYNPNISYIFIGDSNQCQFQYDDIMNSRVFKKLIDYNEVSIQWHDKSRYSQEYDEFLNGLLKFDNGGYDKEAIEYIKAFFKDQVKKEPYNDTNKIKLTYTHAKGKTLSNYMTVHKAQGMTLNEPHSVYELGRMTLKILYTALSRCSDYKLLTLFI